MFFRAKKSRGWANTFLWAVWQSRLCLQLQAIQEVLLNCLCKEVSVYILPSVFWHCTEMNSGNLYKMHVYWCAPQMANWLMSHLCVLACVLGIMLGVQSEWVCFPIVTLQWKSWKSKDLPMQQRPRNWWAESPLLTYLESFRWRGNPGYAIELHDWIECTLYMEDELCLYIVHCLYVYLHCIVFYVNDC